jgi:hypothetical protein
MRMTTIIVHGALAKGATWYASSWEARGFCQAFAAGMSDHDIWLAHGEPVGHYDKLNPKKKWSLWTGTRGILQTVEGPYESTGSSEGFGTGRRSGVACGLSQCVA